MNMEPYLSRYNVQKDMVILEGIQEAYMYNSWQDILIAMNSYKYQIIDLIFAAEK